MAASVERIHAYTYDGIRVPAALTDHTTERGPPGFGYAYNDTATPAAVDDGRTAPGRPLRRF